MPAQSYSSEEQWLKARRGAITGSKAAAILGVDPWKSALQLWAEEYHEKEEALEGEHIYWGHILEGPIVGRYELETERATDQDAPFTLWESEQDPRKKCTPDRHIIRPDDEDFKWAGNGVLEAKNVTEFKATHWTHDAPLWYQVQLQHNMMVLGREWGSFAVLIGGNKFGWMDQAINPKFIRYLIEKEEEFLHLLQVGEPPPADASDSAKEALQRLYPDASGEEIILPMQYAELDSELVQIKDRIKELNERKQFLENQFKAAMKDATFGRLPDGTTYSLKLIKGTTYTVERQDYRRLWRHKK
jgi:putative phage-type endonuclease